MRSMARTGIIVLCALAVSGCVTLAHAQRGARAMRDVERPRFERLAEVLDLSEQQMDQLKELREGGLSQMANQRKEMARVKNEMRGEMLEDNPDINVLKKLVAKESEICAGMRIARIEHQLAMREILTDEQRDKMMMLRGRGGRGGFMNGSRGFRGGRMGHGRGMRGDGSCLGLGGDGPCLGLGFLDPMWDDFGPPPFAEDDESTDE